MKACFADTSYFLALLIPTDLSHAHARLWADTHRAPLMTSDYVVIEVGNYLSSLSTRHLFGRFVVALRSDQRMTVIPGSPELLNRGIELYLARADKQWSLTDCTSFVIMQDRGLSDALTADRHFEQAGFRRLLAQS